ncbi:Uncharacterised protein [Vibrio cholerae]|nr:Uncharacterised protein [Vibrio cholerae]
MVLNLVDDRSFKPLQFGIIIKTRMCENHGHITVSITTPIINYHGFSSLNSDQSMIFKNNQFGLWQCRKKIDVMANIDRS